MPPHKPSASILVRRLKVADIGALEEIESAQAKHYASRPGWLATFRKLVETTLNEEPEGLMIADLDGTVVGWAAVRQRGSHPVSGKRYGLIFHLSVAADYRRRGVGQRLLRESEAYLRSRKCEVIQLSMPVDDPEAAEIFKRSGYRLTAWELEREFR